VWTVDDLVIVSSCLLRLRSNNPAGFRTYYRDIKEPVVEVTNEDWELIRKIEEKHWSQWTDEEKKKIGDHYRIFLFSFISPPDKIKEDVERSLRKLQNELVLAKEQPANSDKRKYDIIEVATKIQFEIGHIHPFEDGHRRLMRIILATIFIQNGIPYVTFGDVQGYQRSLIESERSKSHNILLLYILSLFESQHGLKFNY